MQVPKFSDEFLNPGHPWPTLAIPGQPWPTLAHPGHPWPTLANPGPVYWTPPPSPSRPLPENPFRLFSGHLDSLFRSRRLFGCMLAPFTLFVLSWTASSTLFLSLPASPSTPRPLKNVLPCTRERKFSTTTKLHFDGLWKLRGLRFGPLWAALWRLCGLSSMLLGRPMAVEGVSWEAPGALQRRSRAGSSRSWGTLGPAQGAPTPPESDF